MPPELRVVAAYPIAQLKEAPHPTLAKEWLALLFSDAGKDALRGAGFLVAPP